MPGPFKPTHSIAHFVSASTHHLPAAWVVAAPVYICHHHLHLLDAIDSYAFLGTENRTAHFASHPVSLEERLARFFYLDWQRLRSSDQNGAANLLLVRRLTFFLLLLNALLWDTFF